MTVGMLAEDAGYRLMAAVGGEGDGVHLAFDYARQINHLAADVSVFQDDVSRCAAEELVILDATSTWNLWAWMSNNFTLVAPHSGDLNLGQLEAFHITAAQLLDDIKSTQHTWHTCECTRVEHVRQKQAELTETYGVLDILKTVYTLFQDTDSRDFIKRQIDILEREVKFLTENVRAQMAFVSTELSATMKTLKNVCKLLGRAKSQGHTLNAEDLEELSTELKYLQQVSTAAQNGEWLWSEIFGYFTGELSHSLDMHSHNPTGPGHMPPPPSTTDRNQEGQKVAPGTTFMGSLIALLWYPFSVFRY